MARQVVHSVEETNRESPIVRDADESETCAQPMFRFSHLSRSRLRTGFFFL